MTIVLRYPNFCLPCSKSACTTLFVFCFHTAIINIIIIIYTLLYIRILYISIVIIKGLSRVFIHDDGGMCIGGISAGAVVVVHDTLFLVYAIRIVYIILVHEWEEFMRGFNKCWNIMCVYALHAKIYSVQHEIRWFSFLTLRFLLSCNIIIIIIMKWNILISPRFYSILFSCSCILFLYFSYFCITCSENIHICIILWQLVIALNICAHSIRPLMVP